MAHKFTMAIAVFVLFLIGAPLGSIVRKGGIGTPVVFAVIFFVIFFLLNNFGKKFVKEDVLQPVAGIWMATFILLPIGLFFVYKAMNDSQLMNKEFYFRFFRKVRKSLTRSQLHRCPSPLIRFDLLLNIKTKNMDRVITQEDNLLAIRQKPV